MGSTADSASTERLRVRVAGFDKDPESLMSDGVTSSFEKRRNLSQRNLASVRDDCF